jgi:hypothetical protein
MPFVFGIVGIVLLVSGVRGNSAKLFALVKSDFSGQPNYFEWMIAIFLIGVFGYIKELAPISRMFMFIVLLGLLYKNKQVLSEFNPQEIATPPQENNAQPNATGNSPASQFFNLPSLQQDLLSAAQKAQGMA